MFTDKKVIRIIAASLFGLSFGFAAFDELRGRNTSHVSIALGLGAITYSIISLQSKEEKHETNRTDTEDLG